MMAFSDAPLWVGSSQRKTVLDVEKGKHVPTVFSAKISAAAASTQTMASSSAFLWVGSSFQKAVSDLTPPPRSLRNGIFVATVISVKMIAAAASTRMTSASSVPLWVGLTLRKAVLDLEKGKYVPTVISA
jgi:beta-lactamase class A